MGRDIQKNVRQKRLLFRFCLNILIASCIGFHTVAYPTDSIAVERIFG